MTQPKDQHILLMGPPNVGKSVIFNHFTRLSASCANYSGTTIDYNCGKSRIGGRDFLLVDVPGTYTLNATNEAEQIAVDMLRGDSRDAKQSKCSHCSEDGGEKIDPSTFRPSGVVCVLDANNLESSLYLLLQILEFQLPTTVVALNRVDLAREKGG